MTKRTASGTRGPLTELENQVMQAVWGAGTCTVEAVHQTVSKTRSLKEATVRTLLRRLEKKGFLRHKEEKRAYVYEAVEPARSVAARAVRQIIDRFCQGSMEELVSGMVESEVLTQADIARLGDIVRKAGGKK